jgi:hypothetical protein
MRVETIRNERWGLGVSFGLEIRHGWGRGGVVCTSSIPHPSRFTFLDPEDGKNKVFYDGSKIEATTVIWDQTTREVVPLPGLRVAIRKIQDLERH